MGQLAATSPCFGVLAEFPDSDALLDAIGKAKEAGYAHMEAYTPLPMHDVCHALGTKNRLPLLVLIGGIVGACVGFGLQYWTHVIYYPYNVGGRPLNSWPSFVVVTFEMTILFAALTAVFGMLALNGLPMPYHPVFNVESFALASHDSYFLLIEARDGQFDEEKTREFLESLQPKEVNDVPH